MERANIDTSGPFLGRVSVPRLRVLAAVAIVHLVLSVVPGRVVVLPGRLGVGLADGVALPATLLLGPGGAWGSAVGYLLADGVTGTIGAVSVFGALGQVSLGLAGYRVWHRTGIGWSRDALASLRRYVVAALAGAVTGTTVVAWGYASLGVAPFFVVGALWLPGFVVATLVVGLPTVLVVTYVDGWPPWDPADGATARSGTGLAPSGVIVLTWFLVAIAVSLGFQVAEVVGAGGFRSLGLGVAAPLVDSTVAGDTGATVQSILGATMSLALVLYYFGTVDTA